MPRRRPSARGEVMKRESFGLVVAVALGLSSAVAAAPFELPQPSPQASETLDLGTTELRIDYHRPGVKGRKIWGELVPFGELWRMGANNATKLSVSDPFTVA